MPETTQSSSILEFYNDSKIFITGGTGFLGKALVEKLLRVCTPAHIYLLIRMKKGKDPNTRLKELFDEPLFQLLRKEKPDFEKNVTCIPGDVSGTRLTLSDSEYEFLTNEVTHVFHSAATVRFNEHLKSAVSINVVGTQEIVEFCRKCQRLKVLVHISTAYSHCVKNDIGEEYYDPPLAHEKALSLVDALSEDKLTSLTEELIKPWPNSYAYTKAIAENVIKENAKSMPALIVRPSIVIGTLSDPFEGWVDNLYGPTGIIVGVGVGLIRAVHLDGRCLAGIVPVDLTVNAILSCAWDVGSNFGSSAVVENSTESTDDTGLRKKMETSPPIFNFVPDRNNSITWRRFMEKSIEHGMTFPTIRAIWFLTVTETRIKWIFLIMAFLFHTIPGYIIDVVCVLLGKKPQMTKAYQKIHVFSDAIGFFTCKTWNFTNDNTRKVWSHLSDKDKELFQFNMSTLDWDFCIRSMLIGIRNFILKEPMDTIPAAKRKMFFFWLGHRLIQFAFVAFCFWILSKCLAFGSLKTLADPTLTQTEAIRNSA